VNIMRGYIGVAYNKKSWMTTAAGENFLMRYTAFVQNITSIKGQQSGCNDEVDDDGNYLFKEKDHYNATGNYVCAEVNYTTITTMPDSIEPLIGYVYDTVQIMARGVNAAQYVNANSPLSGVAIKKSLISSTAFTGVTGNFRFSQPKDILDAGGYRTTNLQYDVLNFQVIDDVSEIVTIGLYDYDSATFTLSGTAPVYNSINNAHPVDAVSPVYVNTGPTARIIIAVFVAILLFAHAIETTVFVVYRKTNIMKASQPKPIYFIMFGLFLCCCYVILIEFDLDSNICRLGNFLAHVGYISIVVPLQVKLWRVHVILSAGLSKVKITDSFVMTIILSSVAAVLLLNFIGVGVGNGTLAYYSVEGINGLKTYYPYCSDAVPYINYILYAFEGLGALNVLRLCWETRTAPPFLNDSVHAGSGIDSLYLCLHH
jgi:hypothetical protein